MIVCSECGKERVIGFIKDGKIYEYRCIEHLYEE